MYIDTESYIDLIRQLHTGVVFLLPSEVCFFTDSLQMQKLKLSFHNSFALWRRRFEDYNSVLPCPNPWVLPWNPCLDYIFRIRWDLRQNVKWSMPWLQTWLVSGPLVPGQGQEHPWDASVLWTHKVKACIFQEQLCIFWGAAVKEKVKNKLRGCREGHSVTTWVGGGFLAGEHAMRLLIFVKVNA